MTRARVRGSHPPNGYFSPLSLDPVEDTPPMGCFGGIWVPSGGDTPAAISKNPPVLGMFHRQNRGRTMGITPQTYDYTSLFYCSTLFYLF